ncbi:cysteine desulfurase family protein [Pelagibacterium montanilacus]|uniref:cysteine desulfurase family protein n=1 Tax=Pelagibacterium montanilacus TaxID=2185280 RepID=UPI001FE45E75|nr:aminotransferase class V-fold PLP-dependent enzyme [Pelagibacterium montanilacus]
MAVYLDHNASAPLLPEARQAVVDALALCGNPSSVHGYGRALRGLIDDARDRVAALAGAEAKQVVFTGSGTEALTQAIVGGVQAFRAARIVTSPAEHSAVLKAAEASGVPVSLIGVDAEGRLDVAAIEAEMDVADRNGDETLLFALHWVNGETGVVQLRGRLEALIGPTRHVLVLDAVQGFGKLALDFASSAADMVAVSAHKIGGPAGIGALLVKGHADTVRLVPGGGQEQGRRGGTESAPLIAGFGAAADAYGERMDIGHVRGLALRLEAALKAMAPDAVIFAGQAERIGTTTNFAVPGVKNTVALMALDLAGIAVSSGSACSSGKVARSHVLEAMGVAPGLAECGLRASMGWTTSERDIDALVEQYSKLLERQKSRSGAAA